MINELHLANTAEREKNPKEEEKSNKKDKKPEKKEEKKEEKVTILPSLNINIFLNKFREKRNKDSE